MGTIRIEIGLLNRPLPPMDDAVMTTVLNEVVEATEGPTGGTAAQRADHVLLIIKRYLLETANGWRRRKAQTAAAQQADADQLQLNGS